MKPRIHSLFRRAFPAVAFTLTLQYQAAAQTWTPNANGNWATAASWSPATVPDSVGATVTIGSANITAGRTVSLETTSRTIGSLTFGDTDRSHSFSIIRPAGSTAVLTFDNGANAASLTASPTSASDTIAVPVVLGGSVDGNFNINNTYTIPSGSVTDRFLTLSGGITSGTSLAKVITVTGANTRAGVSISGPVTDGASSISIVKNGTNALNMAGTAANTYTGGLTLNAGTLNLNSATALGATAGTFVVNGGTIASSVTGGSVNANGNAQTWAGNFSFGGNRNVDLGTGAVTLTANRAVTINGEFNGTATPVFTVGGAIGGAGFSLTTQTSGTNASGGGMLVLSGANTYDGGTNINGGTVLFANASAVPTTGTVVIGPRGALALSSTGAYPTIASVLSDARISTTSSGALALTADSSENFDPSAANSGLANLSLGAANNSNVSYTGTLTPGANGYFVGGGGGTITFANTNAFTGANALTVGNGGGGRVVLNTAHDHTGVTTVKAGTVLAIGDSGALGGTTAGTVVERGGSIELSNNVTITGETLAMTNVTSTASPSIYTASLSSVSGVNEWAGNITAVLTGTDNGRISVATGATLNISGDIATSSTTGTTGAIVLTGTPGGIGSVSGDISGTGSIIQNGGTVWTLSGANTYTGSTRIDNGSVSVASIAGNLGTSTSAIGLGETSGTGRLIYTGTGETTARGILLRSTDSNATNGTGVIEQAGASGTLTIAGNVTMAATTAIAKRLVLTGSTAATGVITGNINKSGSNTINVEKTGTGTWELAGSDNTYSGTTTVSGGTLKVSGALNATTSVIVNTGGTLELGSANRIFDSAAISLLNGGTFNTGGHSDTFGTVQFTGSGNILDLAAGTSIIRFADSSSVSSTGTMNILNWTQGSDQVFFGTSDTGLTPAQLASISFVNPFGDGNDYGAQWASGMTGEIVPIPEPSGILLSLLAGLGFISRRKR